MFTDHAEVGSCALFGCVYALFEINDLGVERRIALAQ